MTFSPFFDFLRIHQELPLESIPKRLETAFLWEHTFDSIASLCNNGVYDLWLANLPPFVSGDQPAKQGFIHKTISAIQNIHHY